MTVRPVSEWNERAISTSISISSCRFLGFILRFETTANEMEEEIVCNRWKDLAGDQMCRLSAVTRFVHSISLTGGEGFTEHNMSDGPVIPLLLIVSVRHSQRVL